VAHFSPMQHVLPKLWHSRRPTQYNQLSLCTEHVRSVPAQYRGQQKMQRRAARCEHSDNRAKHRFVPCRRPR
jgi:hypothetical protein